MNLKFFFQDVQLFITKLEYNNITKKKKKLHEVL